MPQKLTKEEQVLWFHLRNRQFARFKFRRQKSIGPYIVDFYCAKRKLIIELDGAHHLQQRSYDRERTAYLHSKGFRVIRFWNGEINSNPTIVLEVIRQELGVSPSSPVRLRRTPSPS